MAKQELQTKKGTVLQAKSLDQFEFKGKQYYPFGVVVKVDANHSDVGTFYHDKQTQEYFVVGEECEYTIELNEKEPKKSKIRPVVQKKDKSITDNKDKYKGGSDAHKQGVSDNFWLMQKLDALKYTVPYAKDECVQQMAQGKYQEGDFDKFANEILKWWHGKIDEIKNSL